MSCNSKKESIEIWSTYPPPFGGVSIHSLRVFENLRSRYNLIFKNFNGNFHKPSINIFRIKFRIIEILKYLFFRNKVIHLHSNNILVWGIMSFYPRSTSILVTIHNQNLKKLSFFFKKLLVKKFLKKVTYIFISNSEMANYLSTRYKLPFEKFVVIPAFIPPSEAESFELPTEIDQFINDYKYIISSFAWKLYKVGGQDVYGIEHIIISFAKLKKLVDSVGLLLIIPIIEDIAHFNKIKELIQQYNLKESILIYTKPVRNGFDIWKKSSLFLRSTITDIEGISIKEALYFGTPVIATNVVERPINVDVYSYGDVEALCNLMLKNIRICDGNKKIDKDLVPNGINEIDRIYNDILS